MFNCIGVNNHRHFFLYLINLTLGILVHDYIIYYCGYGPPTRAVPRLTHVDFSAVSAKSSEECNLLAAELCKIVNSDSYSLVVTTWVTVQLLWVGMLLFVQFIQVSRAMTTYENMFGVDHRSAGALNSTFTSTGAPLDPNHPSATPPSGTAGQSEHVAGHGHKHQHGGRMKQWGKLLGVDAFVETATGRGAATGNAKKRRKNPYSRGCLTNCRDFWCDPAPVFGRRETGAAVLGGETINYTDMYESPRLMQMGLSRRGGTRGTYEAVAAEEV